MRATTTQRHLAADSNCALASMKNCTPSWSATGSPPRLYGRAPPITYLTPDVPGIAVELDRLRGVPDVDRELAGVRALARSKAHVETPHDVDRRGRGRRQT